MLANGWVKIHLVCFLCKMDYGGLEMFSLALLRRCPRIFLASIIFHSMSAYYDEWSESPTVSLLDTF